MMCDISKNIVRVMVGLALFTAVGCGGGGGGGASTPASTQTPTSTVVSYSVANTSGSSIVGLQFSTYLPAGVTVATDSGTNNVKATNLVAGSALSGLQMTLFGTYSAPIRKLKLGIMASDKTALQSGVSGGELLRVNCTVDAGKVLTLDSFKAANNNAPITELFGYSYNQTTKNDINISSALTPSLSVVFK